MSEPAVKATPEGAAGDEVTIETAVNVVSEPAVKATPEGAAGDEVTIETAVNVVSEPAVKATPEGAAGDEVTIETAVNVVSEPAVKATPEGAAGDEVITQTAVNAVSESSEKPTSEGAAGDEGGSAAAAVNADQPNAISSEENKEGEMVAPIDISRDRKPTPDKAKSPDKNEDSSDSMMEWQKREAELLQKIEVLEKINLQKTLDKHKLELKVRDEEIDLLKARVTNLETELQAALSKPGAKNTEMIENIKQQHEELLTKARGMIFDKTKMVKNQELQIEALTTQVQSLKDINQITKDLLEIRNAEMKAMEDRLEAMEAKFKAEKTRYSLVVERANTSSSINDDLRKEYETQLGLFKELRKKYEERVQALVNENARLKDLNQAKGISG